MAEEKKEQKKYVEVDKAYNPANDMLWYMMEQNGVSIRELCRRTGEFYNAAFTALHRDMHVSKFIKYMNAIGCDVIIRNHEQNEGEWKIGEGVRLHEYRGKKTSRNRNRDRAAEGDTEVREDIHREEE